MGGMKQGVHPGVVGSLTEKWHFHFSILLITLSAIGFFIDSGGFGKGTRSKCSGSLPL